MTAPPSSTAHPSASPRARADLAGAINSLIRSHPTARPYAGPIDLEPGGRITQRRARPTRADGDDLERTTALLGIELEWGRV
jgi:hypothetical protein